MNAPPRRVALLSLALIVVAVGIGASSLSARITARLPTLHVSQSGGFITTYPENYVGPVPGTSSRPCNLSGTWGSTYLPPGPQPGDGKRYYYDAKGPCTPPKGAIKIVPVRAPLKTTSPSVEQVVNPTPNVPALTRTSVGYLWWILLVLASSVVVGVTYDAFRRKRMRRNFQSASASLGSLPGTSPIVWFLPLVATLLLAAVLGILGTFSPSASAGHNAQSTTPAAAPSLPCGSTMSIAGRVQRPVALRAGRTITFLTKGVCSVTTGPSQHWTIVDASRTEDVSKTGKLLDTAAVSPACLGLAGNNMKTLALSGFQASFQTPSGIRNVACMLGLMGPYLPPNPSKNRSQTQHNSTSLVWEIVLSVLAVASLLLIAIQRRRHRARNVGEDGEEISTGLLPEPELDEFKFQSGFTEALETLDQTSDPRAAILECWVRFEDAARRAGGATKASDTPGETARRALNAMMLNDSLVDQLCSTYLLARYSPRPITPEMREEMRELIKQVLEEIDARTELSGEVLVSD